VRSAAAIDHLEKMLARAKPAQPEPWLDLAQGQLGQRRFADAERTLTAFLERHPVHPQATEWLALARAGQGKTDDAIALGGTKPCLNSPVGSRGTC
jgi:predicted Zn-dependent protease